MGNVKRNLIVGLVAVVVIVLFFMPVTIGIQAGASGTSVAPGWQEAIVDYGMPQWGGSIASDSQGNQYLVYHTDGAVKYATNKDGSWESTIAAYAQYSQGREATILVGADGHVHLTYCAYTDGTAFPFWSHSEVGGGWMSTSLPIGSFDGPGHAVSIQMAMNSNDVERGCFVDGGLNYLYLIGEAWATQVVDYGGVGTAGIAVDATGVTHIAYPKHSIEGEGLAYASNSQGVWSIQTIEIGNFSEAVICLDNDQNVHVLAVEHSGGLCHLVLLSLKDGFWTRSPVEDATNISACSIKMRPDGSVAVAYYSSGADGIMYGVLRDGIWSKVNVRSGPPSGRTSIAFDKESSPCICYGKASYVTPATLPTFVLFSYVESEQVDLYWSYPGEIRPEEIGAFVLYKGLDSNHLVPFTSLEGAQTSYEDHDVVDLTDYYYQVCAEKDGTNISRSTIAHIWFHTDFNSTIGIDLRTILHGGEAGPVISLEGSAAALTPETRQNGLEIALRVSNTLGVSWDAIGSTITDDDGNFSFDWSPSEGGNYLIEASWQNTTSPAHGVRIISIGVATSADEHSVVVESNSTILDFSFNESDRRAFFEVIGANGSSGYSRVCISKDIAPDSDQINITMDGLPVECTFASEGDYWIIYFEYHHSSHQIVAELPALATPLITVSVEKTTYVPGSDVQIIGSVVNSTTAGPLIGVTVKLSIVNANLNQVSESATVFTTSTGDFSATLFLPMNAIPGTYSIRATATLGSNYTAFSSPFQVHEVSILVVGKVVEPSGDPVVGATVNISGHSTTTDANGNFQLDVMPGNCTVNITLGQRTHTSQFTVSAESYNVGTITLPALPGPEGTGDLTTILVIVTVIIAIIGVGAGLLYMRRKK